MNFELPGNGKGKDGLLSTVEQVLKYSVNTWDQGFLDKLYASTNAVSFSFTGSSQKLNYLGGSHFRASLGSIEHKCKSCVMICISRT